MLLATTETVKRTHWRYAILALVVLVPLALLLSVPPIPQDPSYHLFADSRRIFGIPNFFDVVSNLPFLFVGWVGIAVCIRRDVGPAKVAWLVLFTAIALVSFGSAYYHWSPSNESLVWDRLPMTIGFMGFMAAILSEYVHPRLGTRLLGPLVLIGLGSVVYWDLSGDLRLYAWVQFFPLLLLVFVMTLFRSKYSRQWLLLAAIGWYVLAKNAEVWDLVVFDGTGHTFSGHTLKHLLAAAGCVCLLAMIRSRKEVFPETRVPAAA